jgi:uncharacterized membrane protein
VLGAARRVVGVDAARGVALLGMMTVHVQPAVVDGRVTPAYLVAGGRSAALFALLAGVGLALATGGVRPRTGEGLRAARRGVVARAAVIVVVGLLLGELESRVAVILVHYGLLFVLVLPFLGWGPGRLAVAAAVVAVVVPALGHVVRPLLPDRTYGSPSLSSLETPLQLLTELTLTGYYPTLAWTAYVLVGLAVGRLPLRRAGTAVRVVVAGLALAVGARVVSGLLLGPLGGRAGIEQATGAAHLLGRDLDIALRTSMYGATPTTTWWWLAVVTPHSTTPLDLAHTAGVALAVLGVCLLVLPRPRWFAAPLVAVGSMTLSLYTLHVVLLSTLLPRDLPYALWWHVVVALGVGLVWRTFVGRGPLEAVAARASALAAGGWGPAGPAGSAALRWPEGSVGGPEGSVEGRTGPEGPEDPHPHAGPSPPPRR